MTNRGRGPGQHHYGEYPSAYSSAPPQVRPSSAQFNSHIEQFPLNPARRQYSACVSQSRPEQSNSYPSNMSQQHYNAPTPTYLPNCESYDTSSSVCPVVNKPPSTTYIDEATTSWLNKLRHMWTLYKRSPAVTQTLHGYFNTSPNAYQSALFVMINCGDFHQAKANSLAFTVMEEFSRWLVPKRDSLQACLTQEVKLEAFKTVTNQRQPQLVKMVIDAYEMGQHKELFMKAISELIGDKQYKEACQSVTHLGLHQLFAVEDILVPLVFQDKLNVAFEFLANSPKHQKELVIYLDNLLGLRSIRNEVQNIILRLEIPDAKHDKLYGKPLSKLVARLVKTYNLSEDFCPNLNKKRRDGALQFIIGKRYQDRNLSLDSWREMALEAIRDDPEMHAELVSSVSQAGDPAEALYWARRLGVPENCWPVLVHDEASKVAPMTSHLQSASENHTENWDESSGPTIDYHPFALTLSDITIVDSVETFNHLHEAIRNVSLVGIDSEWKAHFGTGGTKLALIQVAIERHVFILDVTSMSQYPDTFEQHWRHLAVQLFNNRDIRKLGFGLSSDLQMIRSTVRGLANVTQQGTNFLEFIHLWKYLVAEGLQFSQEGCDSGGEGLSRLVECSLGRPLNKAEQFSNWENRPLRECQLIYAAADAHCLLQVYQALERRCSQSDRFIPFDLICDEVVSSIKMKKIRKVKPVMTEVQESLWGTPQRAGNIKAICDNMIHGLGLHLRMCGVDVINLHAGQAMGYVQDVISRDRRIIITKGKRFNELASYAPPGYCYSVKSEIMDEQVAEVLQYFNIILTRDDVFTRCSKCNSANLIVVSNATMAQLALHSASTQSAAASYYNPNSRWLSPPDSDEEEGHAAPSRASNMQVMYRPPEPGIDISSCTTSVGAKIGVESIPEDVIARMEVFYVCQHCGKCYWDGSHIERFIESIKEYLST